MRHLKNVVLTFAVLTLVGFGFHGLARSASAVADEITTQEFTIESENEPSPDGVGIGTKTQARQINFYHNGTLKAWIKLNAKAAWTLTCSRYVVAEKDMWAASGWTWSYVGYLLGSNTCNTTTNQRYVHYKLYTPSGLPNYDTIIHTDLHFLDYGDFNWWTQKKAF
jgi:hypothetical protein